MSAGASRCRPAGTDSKYLLYRSKFVPQFSGCNNLSFSQSSHATTTSMARKSVTIHSSLLFDPKQKAFVKDVSIRVDTDRGSIAQVYVRKSEEEITDGIDLRGRVVMPGLVDAHTHIFLHPYRYRTASPGILALIFFLTRPPPQRTLLHRADAR